MKNKKILFLALGIMAIVISGFGFQSGPSVQQGKTSQDTITKNATVADSLKLVSNLKLKVFKKNAHASYYHDKFNGRRTASGRKFSNKGLTAAHRKLPFGTKIKVTNEKNGKSIIVEVTDRGPFTRGRDIDLTKRAFMDIAGAGWGGALKVTIEVIE